MGELADKCVKIGVLPKGINDTINGLLNTNAHVVAGVTDSSDLKYPDLTGKVNETSISEEPDELTEENPNPAGYPNHDSGVGGRVGLSRANRLVRHSEPFETTADALAYNTGLHALNNVPDRPFLALAAKSLIDESLMLQYVIDEGVFPAIMRRTGKRSGMDVLRVLSKFAENYFVHALFNNTVDLEANAPYTVYKKGEDAPLIESGLLLKAITAEVRRN